MLHLFFATEAKDTDNLEFSVLFNYKNHPKYIRLQNVFFGDFSFQGYGKKFLSAVILAAMDLGCERIYVEPDYDGSYYWTRRGALIQTWPVGRNDETKDERKMPDDS